MKTIVVMVLLPICSLRFLPAWHELLDELAERRGRPEIEPCLPCEKPVVEEG